MGNFMGEAPPPTTSPGDSFACPHCGQVFPWDAQQAGRRLGCVCGQVITVPISFDPPPESYELADEPVGEVKVAPLAPQAERATPVLAYDTARSQKGSDEFWDRFRDAWLPIGSIAVGLLIISATCVAVVRMRPISVPELIMSVSIRLGWDLCVTIVVGAFLAWLLDTSLGEVQTALLKLTAVAVSRFAIWSMFGLTTRFIGGDIVGFILSLPVLMFMISYLFELDFRDTFVAVCFLTLLRWISYFGMFKLLP
jgi:hypothetical protein